MTVFEQLSETPGHRQLLEGETPVVLVVDDDPTLLTMLAHILMEDGHTVIRASSGRDAVELAAAHSPHIILMDAIMPDMTGFEASKQILDAAQEEQPLLVMVTGLNDESSVNRAYESGATDYITKPIHWAVLRNRITHLAQSLQASSYRRMTELRMRNANKMETIGKLTGGIAHDFNNILSSILGYTELARIQHPSTDDKLGNYLNEVERSGVRAKRLIQQMLTFCRGDTIEPQFIDGAQAIHDVVRMLQATLPSSIHFTLDIEEDLPPLYADFIQLEQALMNLCVNARDALGDTGKITISVSRHEVTESYCASCHTPIDGEYIDITIHDTGPGIDESVRKDLFVPFISTKKATSGTGLGLSVVDGILHGHQGHVLVESSAESGTSFHLLFPIVTPPGQAQPQPA